LLCGSDADAHLARNSSLAMRRCERHNALGANVPPTRKSRLDLAGLLSPTQDGAALEERLIWRCAHVTLTPAQLAEVAALGARLDEPAWERMVALAQANGVGNLLFTHIAAAGLLSRAPESVIARLRQRYGAVIVATRRMEVALARLLPQLYDAQGPVIIVKGITLSRRLYGNIALRPISDIDMLARPERAPRWIAALRAAGFEPVAGKSQRLSKHVLRFREMQFQNASGQVVEMHVNVCRYPDYQRAFPAGEVWARARPLEGMNGHALSLASADELCFLCMHYAVQHQIGRLIWLVDVAEIVRRVPDEQSWDALVEDIIARGAAAPVAVTLAQARALLDAPMPINAWERLRSAALEPAERRAWASATRPMSGARWYLSQLRAVRTPMERATLLWNGGAALTRRLRRRQRPSPLLADETDR
jgi:putative nucleotidyltransferase-like protein